MQTVETENLKRTKNFISIPVKPKTKAQIQQIIDRLNQKEFGRKIIPDDLISVILTLGGFGI